MASLLVKAARHGDSVQDVDDPGHQLTTSAKRLVLALVCLAMIALAALHGLGFKASFNTLPSTALQALPPPPGQVAPTTPVERAVVLVVDGLRDDKAALLGLEPPLATTPQLRCVQQVAWPSFSRPNYVALSSAVPPQLSGVHNNSHAGPVNLDSLWDAARQSGLEVWGVTDGIDWWFQLYPDAWSQRVSEPEAFRRSSERLFGDSGPSLALVHIVSVDEQGHLHGAMSPEYDAAARRAGELIRALRQRMDPSRDLLVVTSDHGHIDRGGHGGPEPEVINVPLYLMGAGVHPSVGPGCALSVLDVAPTVAALLGLRPLAQAVGSPLVGLMHPVDVDPRPILAAYGHAARSMSGAAGAALSAPMWRPPSLDWLLLGVAGWLGLTWLVWWLTRPGYYRPSWRDGVAAAVYPGVFIVVYALAEPTLSMSAVWEQDPWIVRLAGLVAASVVIAWTVTRLILGRADALTAMGRWPLQLGAAALPLVVAFGVHGGLAGGPRLGNPHAAFGLVVGDFIAIGGATAVLAALTIATLRERFSLRAR